MTRGFNRKPDTCFKNCAFSNFLRDQFGENNVKPEDVVLYMSDIKGNTHVADRKLTIEKGTHSPTRTHVSGISLCLARLEDQYSIQ